MTLDQGSERDALEGKSPLQSLTPPWKARVLKPDAVAATAPGSSAVSLHGIIKTHMTCFNCEMRKQTLRSEPGQPPHIELIRTVHLHVDHEPLNAGDGHERWLSYTAPPSPDWHSNHCGELC